MSLVTFFRPTEVDTQQKMNNLFKVDQTVLDSVLLLTLFIVVKNIVQHCYTQLHTELGSGVSFNIVDSKDQCGQQNVCSMFTVSSTSNKLIINDNFLVCTGR